MRSEFRQTNTESRCQVTTCTNDMWKLRNKCLNLSHHTNYGRFRDGQGFTTHEILLALRYIYTPTYMCITYIYVIEYIQMHGDCLRKPDPEWIIGCWERRRKRIHMIFWGLSIRSSCPFPQPYLSQPSHHSSSQNSSIIALIVFTGTYYFVLLWPTTQNGTGHVRFQKRTSATTDQSREVWTDVQQGTWIWHGGDASCASYDLLLTWLSFGDCWVQDMETGEPSVLAGSGLKYSGLWCAITRVQATDAYRILFDRRSERKLFICELRWAVAVEA